MVGEAAMAAQAAAVGSLALLATEVAQVAPMEETAVAAAKEAVLAGTVAHVGREVPAVV